jgi:biotin operon repressor
MDSFAPVRSCGVRMESRRAPGYALPSFAPAADVVEDLGRL